MMFRALSIQNKEIALNISRERTQMINEGKSMRITVDFSMTNLKVRRLWSKALPIP